MKKLNQKGMAHYILPVIVVLLIAAVGTKVLLGSHADNLTPATLNVTTSALSTDYNQAAVLTSANTAPGTDNALSSVPFSFVGTQRVSYIDSGQTLTYDQGIKGPVQMCYLVYVTQPKSGTATVTAEFANYTNVVTKTLSSTTSDNLQQVCVPVGNETTAPGFSVKNINPTSNDANLEVFADILSW